MPRAKKADSDPMSHLVLVEDEEVLATADKDDGSVVVVTSEGRKWSLTAGGAELLMGPALPSGDEDEEPMADEPAADADASDGADEGAEE